MGYTHNPSNTFISLRRLPSLEMRGHPLTACRRFTSSDTGKSRIEQITALFREHGVTFVGLYTASYAVCVGAAWGALGVAEVDGVALLRKLGSDRVIDLSEWPPRWVNLGIATVIADLVEPVRLPMVVAA